MQIGNKKTKSKLMSFFLFICLSVAVFTMALMAYYSNKGYDIKSLSILEMKELIFTKEIKAEESILVGQFGYKLAEHPVFIAYKEYIVKCSNDNLKYFSKSGEIVFEKNLLLKTPIVRTNGSELLVTDLGSKEINVFKDKELKWTAKVDGPVINADISSTGHISVVHDEKGYKSAVTVFNLQGVPFFTRRIVEYLALNAKVSQKSQNVAISMLDTSGIVSKAVFEITNILGTPTGERITNIEDLCSQVWYLDGDNALACGSKAIVAVDKLNKEKWRYEVLREKISGTIQLDSKNIVAIISNGEKEMLTEAQRTKVLKFNVEGKETEIYKSSKSVKSINARDGIVALNYGDSIDFISSAGRLVGTYKSDLEAVEVILLSSEEAAVVTKTVVEIIKIK